jgi:hypothetical protein
MADLWLRRTVFGFVALDPDDVLPSWKVGDVIFASLKKPRNGALHRKAFVLLDQVWPHTEYPNKELLRKAMTIGAGFVDTVVNPMTGAVSYVPKSWAFSAMDDDEFRELYQRLIDVALKIVPRSSRDDWEDAVENIIRM